MLCNKVSFHGKINLGNAWTEKKLTDNFSTIVFSKTFKILICTVKFQEIKQCVLQTYLTLRLFSRMFSRSIIGTLQVIHRFSFFF
jgi:hypothetical protein